MRLGLVEIFTPDLAEAERFYRDVLGLALTAQSDGQLVFDAGAVELHVFRCVRPSQHAHAEAAGTACAFEVASIEAEMARMGGLGVVFLHERPAHNALARVRYVAFEAPGGNVHELIQRDRRSGVS